MTKAMMTIHARETESGKVRRVSSPTGICCDFGGKRRLGDRGKLGASCGFPETDMLTSECGKDVCGTHDQREGIDEQIEVLYALDNSRPDIKLLNEGLLRSRTIVVTDTLNSSST